MEEENTIQTEIGELYWIDKENGIVCGKTKQDVAITIEKLKIDFEMYQTHFKHPHRKLFFDMSRLSNANSEVREFFAGPEGIYNYFDAIAVYTDSKFSIAGIIASVAVKVYILRKPTKLFHDKQKAIDWLRAIQ